MTQPIRLQLFRRKGFNLQTASMAANGLPAVNVAVLLEPANRPICEALP